MAAMTTAFHFPPLRLGLLSSLLQVKERVDADGPETLEGSDYDNETKNILLRLFAPKIVEKRVEVPQEKERAGRGRPTKDVALSPEDQEKLKGEIEKLMEELNKLGDTDNAKEVQLDTGQRIQIVKAKAGLLDQLLKMQERAFNIKRMSFFQETVIGILDDLVSEDDRETFLKRIDQFRD